MRRLKIVVIQEIEIPDEATPTVHPTDQVECVEVNGKYYLPTITWLERFDEAQVVCDASDEEAGADWYLSDTADLLFSNLIGEDGIIHEIKTPLPQE